MKSTPAAEGVEAVARAVEAGFDQCGLTVTMGGEPTFIPDHPEAAEWNQAALGSEKLGYARRLTSRLLRELYPGGLVMQVHGKQYPEEPVPRWMILTLQRDDGVPMWHHPELFLLGDSGAVQSDEVARDLMAALSSELGLMEYALPCVEKKSPAGSVRGWVLPLDFVEGSWVSDDWPFSSERPVVLVPGESPLGIRLPLGEIEDGLLKRALTIEVTEGALHVFIPPLDLGPFTVLTRLIEGVAVAEKASNLVLCGYRPTNATGVTALGLSADPGVLEVNLPPSKTWQEYDRTLRLVTRAANDEGLRTYRLHLNGQVQGTGGGAHVLFGGPTVEQSPFFERPDLLGSVLRYWQRHPALSYFFSGQYVGPGSQAPRADETLSSKLYELETACMGVDMVDPASDRSALDRLFRNLLTDSAGNMHLAEVSIDKLWNYDSPTGLQGLIELRAFETMQDVAHQSLAALFVRAVLAMLARAPCRDPLVRHGPRLHDRYMLPAALREDLGEICADLDAAGLAFEPSWLEALYEARFPILGRLQIGGAEVVLRQALEPWPLLAEMHDGGSTSRLVDNSTDRVEVSLTDPALLDEAQVVVSGVRLRLHEVSGTPVAGVRYKAAGGWPALHPHIEVQSPLAVEVVDWSGRCMAGGRYYYWNPDAPRYEGRPLTLGEAARRRAERWKPFEPDEAIRKPRAPVYAEECVFTLDLRRQS